MFRRWYRTCTIHDDDQFDNCSWIRNFCRFLFCFYFFAEEFVWYVVCIWFVALQQIHTRLYSNRAEFRFERNTISPPQPFLSLCFEYTAMEKEPYVSVGRSAVTQFHNNWLLFLHRIISYFSNFSNYFENVFPFLFPFRVLNSVNHFSIFLAKLFDFLFLFFFRFFGLLWQCVMYVAYSMFIIIVNNSSTYTHTHSHDSFIFFAFALI